MRATSWVFTTLRARVPFKQPSPRPQPLPSEPVSTQFAESRNAYYPRHIPRNETQNIKRIAVLLPFNSTNADVQRQSKGIYNAIQMALFLRGHVADFAGIAVFLAAPASDYVTGAAITVDGGYSVQG